MIHLQEDFRKSQMNNIKLQTIIMAIITITSAVLGENPPRVIVHPKSQCIPVDEPSVTLTCEFSTPVTCVWRRGGNLVSIDNRYSYRNIDTYDTKTDCTIVISRLNRSRDFTSWMCSSSGTQLYNGIDSDKAVLTECATAVDVIEIYPDNKIKLQCSAGSAQSQNYRWQYRKNQSEPWNDPINVQLSAEGLEIELNGDNPGYYRCSAEMEGTTFRGKQTQIVTINQVGADDDNTTTIAMASVLVVLALICVTFLTYITCRKLKGETNPPFLIRKKRKKAEESSTLEHTGATSTLMDND